MKGISVNGKHSYNDFSLCVGERTISPPNLKRITETVPYMNGEYDFSSINGEIALESRSLSYEFDIAEITTEKMEEIKSNFLSWLYSIVDTNIFDDYLKNYYFHGSLDKIDWSEDFGKGIITVTFSVDPYMYEINETTEKFEVNNTTDIIIMTNSSHPIIPTISTTSEITIKVNDNSFSIPKGDFKSEDLKLQPGENKISILGNATVSFTYRNEVL